MKTYDAIIVDVFNFIYRHRAKNPPNLIRSVINGIEDDVRSRISKDGTLYLLFDPLPEDDLGMAKTFTYTGFRRDVLASYKSNRTVDPNVQKVAGIVRKYYLYRGDHVKVSTCEEYEADDYVEPLMKRLRGSDVALVTTDEDWAGFVDDTTVLINDRWDRPFTRNAFKLKFKFEPTPASIVLYKSLYGDTSDNVTGAIHIKKAKFTSPIKRICYEAIKHVASSGTSIDEFVSGWRGLTYMDVLKKKDRTPIEELYFHMEAVDQKAPVMEALFTNLCVIRSGLSNRNIDDFLVSNPERPEVNSVIHGSIFGVNFKNKFGKV